MHGPLLVVLPLQILPGMRPFMLPVFFYGGQISKALESESLNAAQEVALTEIRSLLTWLLMQLGIINRKQADVLVAFTPLPRPSTLKHRKGECGTLLLGDREREGVTTSARVLYAGKCASLRSCSGFAIPPACPLPACFESQGNARRSPLCHCFGDLLTLAC
jgi:hypothetical protein